MSENTHTVSNPTDLVKLKEASALQSILYAPGISPIAFGVVACFVLMFIQIGVPWKRFIPEQEWLLSLLVRFGVSVLFVVLYALWHRATYSRVVVVETNKLNDLLVGQVPPGVGGVLAFDGAENRSAVLVILDRDYKPLTWM